MLGLKMRMDFPQWVRGPARVVGDWIEIDPADAQPYHAYTYKDTWRDLANVSDRRDAAAFATRYGLLRQSSPDTDGRLRESWQEFNNEVQTLKTTLELARVVRGVARKSPELADALKAIQPVLTPLFQAPAASDDELLHQATQVVAWRISERMAGVELVVDIGEKPNDFILAVRAPTLLGYAYHSLAQALVNRRELRMCRECSSVFVVEDKRQQFCSEACSKRARQRRYIRGKRNRGAK